ncbi:MAG: hypothetical protein ACD_48C00628G0003 [uncultured bacterium]|nr:MAG: hypothetical protein ACD_48C00628G0003 [uncultured bacterium]
MINSILATAVNDYLVRLFTNIQLPVQQFEDAERAKKNINEYIFSKINRKKFRRKQLSEKSQEAIQNKIKISVEAKNPIHFVVPFGGYKHFWNPSHPEPDWAELFHFRYITEYVLPILQMYNPGVIVEYVSEDLILPRMNNYPDEAIEKYISVFKSILDWYKTYVPKNLQFRFFRVSDRCDKEKIVQEVEALLPERKKTFIKLSDEAKLLELKRSNRSMYWKGKLDLSNLEDGQKQERIIESRLIELAYYDTEAKPEYLGNYLGEDDHICICFSFGLSPDNALDDLTLGSTFGSIVDYWIGRGVLEHVDGKFNPRIVSHNQYEEVLHNVERVKTSLIIPGKNLSEIEVIPPLF